MLAEPDMTALPLTATDQAPIIAFHAEMRPCGVKIDICWDHLDYPDTAEVTFPRQPEPWIMFRRTGAGVLVWECDCGARIGRWRRVFPDMAAALDEIRAHVAAEAAEALALIPERLGVDLSGLFGGAPA